MSNTILEDAEPLTHLYDSKNYEAETVVSVILQVKRWKPTPLPALELSPPPHRLGDSESMLLSTKFARLL